MRELLPFVNRGGTVIELGSRDGINAAEIAEIVQADRVITIEANPDAWADIERNYPQFENYNCAISNSNTFAKFYKVGHEFGPTILGQSSLLYKPSYDTIATEITVECFTMDTFTDDHGIESIEVLKIDVEGATYEALQGFTKIRMTRLLHIESEHQQFWEGQRLYEDTERFMTEAGYDQVYFAPVWTNQSDTIWLRKD